jgi:hypothetical protein
MIIMHDPAPPVTGFYLLTRAKNFARFAELWRDIDTQWQAYYAARAELCAWHAARAQAAWHAGRVS